MGGRRLQELVHDHRVIFILAFADAALSLDVVMEAVQTQLQPERMDTAFVTSWFVESGFTKDELDVLVTELYDKAETEFRFELQPEKTHSSAEVDTLRQWVALLSKTLC